jgi:hypothetical protein
MPNSRSKKLVLLSLFKLVRLLRPASLGPTLLKIHFLTEFPKTS